MVVALLGEAIVIRTHGQVIDAGSPAFVGSGHARVCASSAGNDHESTAGNDHQSTAGNDHQSTAGNDHQSTVGNDHQPTARNHHQSTVGNCAGERHCQQLQLDCVHISGDHTQRDGTHHCVSVKPGHK